MPLRGQPYLFGADTPTIGFSMWLREDDIPFLESLSADAFPKQFNYNSRRSSNRPNLSLGVYALILRTEDVPAESFSLLTDEWSPRAYKMKRVSGWDRKWNQPAVKERAWTPWAKIPQHLNARLMACGHGALSRPSPSRSLGIRRLIDAYKARAPGVNAERRIQLDDQKKWRAIALTPEERERVRLRQPLQTAPASSSDSPPMTRSGAPRKITARNFDQYKSVWSIYEESDEAKVSAPEIVDDSIFD